MMANSAPGLDSSFTDKESILVWQPPEAEPEAGFECKQFIWEAITGSSGGDVRGGWKGKNLGA